MKIEPPRWHADAWNASADRYDSPAMSFFERIGARAVDLLQLPWGGRIIDCACGSGHATLPAAERVGPDGRVIGVDVAARLLDLAGAKAQRRGLGNLDLRLGDMQQIDYGAEQFDAVLCLFAMYFASDMVALVRRFWRHLRPGGQLGIAVWAPKALEPLRREIWLPSLAAEVPELIAQSAARDRVGEGEPLRAILTEAGIAECELLVCEEVQPFESPETWWEILLGLGPTRWLIDRMTPEQRARVKQANVEKVGERGATGVNVDWIFVRATKPRAALAGAESAQATFRELLSGAWIMQAIYVAARLGIADHLDAGPTAVDDLAREVRADPSSLYRLLRALSAVGVFFEAEGRRFATTPLGELLRRDHADSVRNLVLLRGMPETSAAWGALLSTVETGRPGFEQVFASKRFDHFEANPEAARIFHDAMDDKTRRVAPAIARHYDFASIRRLVDVGGGHGRLLGTILGAHEHLLGTLLDRPSVIAGARAILDALDVTARVELVPGDFFAEVPRADGYILFNILHDWSDEDARRILGTITRAMAPDARVLIVEMVIPPERNQPSPAVWMDLHMLVALGGCERTEEDFRALASGAGLRLDRVVKTPTPYSILECRAGTSTSPPIGSRRGSEVGAPPGGVPDRGRAP